MPQLTHSRVKIATIRNFGTFPCPRCLVPKDKIPEIGKEEDRRTRAELGRTDTVERQGLVDQARKNLYEHGYALSGDFVDGILKDSSLVPTRVRKPHSQPLYRPEFSPECVLTGSVQVWVRLLQDPHGGLVARVRTGPMERFPDAHHPHT